MKIPTNTQTYTMNGAIFTKTIVTATTAVLKAASKTLKTMTLIMFPSDLLVNTLGSAPPKSRKASAAGTLFFPRLFYGSLKSVSVSGFEVPVPVTRALSLMGETPELELVLLHRCSIFFLLDFFGLFGHVG